LFNVPSGMSTHRNVTNRTTKLTVELWFFVSELTQKYRKLKSSFPFPKFGSKLGCNKPSNRCTFTARVPLGQ
jgi:hypothetical protein